MKNKRGTGYIPTCIITIILCMILSVMIMFVSTVNVIKQTERNSKVVLDSFVMKQSIVNYNNIKRGSNAAVEIDSEEYVNNLCDFCTFERKANRLYNYDSDGEVQFSISVPTVKLKIRQLKIDLSYTIYVPLKFAGITVSTVAVPVTVTSKYLGKF